MEQCTFNLFEFTNKFQNYAHLCTEKTERDIFTKFYNNIDKDIILNELNSLLKVNSIKCEKKAESIRKEGFKYYRMLNYEKVLENCNEILINTSHDSHMFPLTLANRSRVLFQLKKYQECIMDIELSLKLDLKFKYFNNEFTYNLYIRLTTCYLNLNLIENAQSTIITFKEYLKNKNLSSGFEDIVSRLSKFEREIFLKKETNQANEINNCEKFPILKNGENKNFVNASSAVRLSYNKLKGRHVVANEDLNVGDVLFVEKAFISITCIHDDEYCYHCFKPTIAPISCNKCAEQFCSFKCFEDSLKYHSFECLASCVNFWRQIGIFFPATRLLLLGAETKYKNICRISPTNDTHFGDKENNYDYVCSLVSNVEKMKTEEILPYAVGATMVVVYLTEKTNFFEYFFSQDLKYNKEDVIHTVGGILLKHALQILANASLIKTPWNYFYERFNNNNFVSSTVEFKNVGSGLYPSVSMMNHSCEPNISNYFINDYIVVKAKVNIAKGEEICNCYGPRYNEDELTTTRQLKLSEQYYFECQCTACTYPTKPEMYIGSLLCQKCKGRVLNKKHNNLHQCDTCKHEFSAANHYIYRSRSNILMNKYETTGMIEHLEKCLELRDKIFYKYTYEIFLPLTYLELYYAQSNNFFKFWEYSQRICELSGVLFGENDIMRATKLRPCLIILLDFLKNLSTTTQNALTERQIKNLQSKTKPMFLEVQTLFSLYFSEEKLSYDWINSLMQQANDNVDIVLTKKLFITETLETS